MNCLSPYAAINELRDQLLSEKRKIGFFLGAGTSMSIGIPGIDKLTNEIKKLLGKESLVLFNGIEKDCNVSNVEIILNRLRTYRELIGDNSEREYAGIKGKENAQKLDSDICSAISKIVQKDVDMKTTPHIVFSQWLKALSSERESPVELFTTNYDLFLERAMEQCAVPYFDGFVGAVQPFFAPEAVEAINTNYDGQYFPPKGWTRLWKIHGSINWYIIKSPIDNSERISRICSDYTNSTELVIFPSREKYQQSRKLPFIAFQDRLRRFLSQGECLMIVLGYSYSDQHINDIIIQGLKSNPRLAVLSIQFEDATDIVKDIPKHNSRFTAYTRNRICIGGCDEEWSLIEEEKANEIKDYYDDKNKHLSLGDFKVFAKFLNDQFLTRFMYNDKKGSTRT